VIEASPSLNIVIRWSVSSGIESHHVQMVCLPPRVCWHIRKDEVIGWSSVALVVVGTSMSAPTLLVGWKEGYLARKNLHFIPDFRFWRTDGWSILDKFKERRLCCVLIILSDFHYEITEQTEASEMLVCSRSFQHWTITHFCMSGWSVSGLLKIFLAKWQSYWTIHDCSCADRLLPSDL